VLTVTPEDVLEHRTGCVRVSRLQERTSESGLDRQLVREPTGRGTELPYGLPGIALQEEPTDSGQEPTNRGVVRNGLEDRRRLAVVRHGRVDVTALIGDVAEEGRGVRLGPEITFATGPHGRLRVATREFVVTVGQRPVRLSQP